MPMRILFTDTLFPLSRMRYVAQRSIFVAFSIDFYSRIQTEYFPPTCGPVRCVSQGLYFPRGAVVPRAIR
jgi:hypothetical protein